MKITFYFFARNSDESVQMVYNIQVFLFGSDRMYESEDGIGKGNRYF